MNLNSFIRLCNRYNEKVLKITSKLTGYDAKDELYSVRAIFGGFLNGDSFVITLKTNLKNGSLRYEAMLGVIWFDAYKKSYKMYELEELLIGGVSRLTHFINANTKGGGAYIEVTGDL